MDFNARSSALGYFYQVRYALYLLLIAERDEAELAIEKLDDISFEENGSPTELLQTKHHISSVASLTNSSADLWKTIRIWSTQVAQNQIRDDTILSLVTTASAPNDDTSIARKLKPTAGRDNKHISLELLEVANRSKSEELKPAFEAYRSLSPQQREKLVSSVQLLDNSPDILNTAEKIKTKLIVLREHRDACFNRLEGWWFDRIVRHLRSGSTDTRVYAQ
jgi:hypothetical protein